MILLILIFNFFNFLNLFTKGPIPWDDDLDYAIKLEDIDTLDSYQVNKDFFDLGYRIAY